MEIFNLSPFVRRQFEQNSYLYKLVETKLDLKVDWCDFQSKNSHLDIFSLTRKFRQTRLALIAVKDTQGKSAIEHLHTLKQTSLLAKLLITSAYNYALNEMQSKFGDVVNSKGEKQLLIIFALGKLGGNELNYSSDVDLVFCYSGNGQSNNTKTLDAQTYFSRLGRRIIQILDSITPEGIVYRVDMRLRPFGGAAPLSCSISTLLTYLESEGRDWERYAWLRASFIAGDKKIARDTLKNIEPFIYRKYLDYTIFDSLRQIKSQIQRKQINDQDNLKLGYGGIREIEFIIQTLQITFGGRNKQLRGNNLWEQIHNLSKFNHINTDILQQLTSAWLFLRKLENLCQIIHDRDSHHLPSDAKHLALCIGLNKTENLQKALNQHRDNVNSIFKQLFFTNQTNDSVVESHPEIQEIKDQISQNSYPKIIKHKIYSALDAIHPLLSQHTNKSKIIKRYYQVINSVSKRPSYISMLVESPLILKKLVTQISYSQYFSSCISKNPSLMELLFETTNDHNLSIKKQWCIFNKKHNTHDVEQQLELLVQFKQSIQFNAIVAFIDEINDSEKTCLILSNLATFILEKVIGIAWRQSKEKIQTNILLDDLIVIAYGSLATKTMSLDSDFDLVFVLSKEITETNHKFVMRWIKRIVHYLTIQNYSGSLYQLDTQLRPNGKSGAAIISQNNFENYQKNKAWTWEHAALIKARAVYATKPLSLWFNALRKEVLTQKRDGKKIVNDLKEMITKMQDLEKNHYSEFEQLGNILINAHDSPTLIDKYYFPNLKQKLNKSIN